MILHWLSMISTLTMASSFYIQPFPDFIQGASLILRGTFHNVRVVEGVSDDNKKSLYTLGTFEITEKLKGNIASSSVEVKKTGGSKDGVTVEIPGSPEFREAEESVLFLGPEMNDHTYEVSGLELGKFGVRDDHGETELVGGALSYPVSDTSLLSQPHSPSVDRHWTLKKLREQIRDQESNASHGDTSVKPREQNSETSPDRPNRDSSSTPNPTGSSVSDVSATSNDSTPWSKWIAGFLTLALFIWFKRRR